MWTDEQIDTVKNLLMNFNGASEVCAVLSCSADELDLYCLHAFNMDFNTTKDFYAARGRAALRQTLMDEALDGNVKALDMLAREQLGMGAVEIRKNRIKEGDDGDDDEAYLAAVIASATRPTV